ncbi:mitotic fidelity of chromosome transmission- protein [Tilletia horrida]|nr:mitotic fidelity of chromosome transmission- protein [Tilletia horrida]
MSTRRFYEENTGGRTGLRIPSLTRDSGGFEDTDQFYEASKKRMAERRGLNAQDEEEDDDYQEEEDDYDDDDHLRDRTDDEDGPDRQSADEYANSLVDHHQDGTDDGNEDETDDDAVEGHISSGLRNTSRSSQSKSRSSGTSAQASTSMDLETSEAPSPQAALRMAQASSRRAIREPTPIGDDAGTSTEDESRTSRGQGRSSPAIMTPGQSRRDAGGRVSTLSSRELNFDSTIGGGDFDNNFADDHGDEGLDLYNDAPEFPDNEARRTDADADRSLNFSDGVATPSHRSGDKRARRDHADGVEDDVEDAPVKRPGRKSGESRISDASSSRSSVGGSSLSASMGRRAFNRLRHTASMTPNRTADTQDTPSRASVSQPSPAKSAVSSVSSAGGRALDFNDYGDDDNMGGGYDGPDYGDDNDDGGAPAAEVIVEEDVGPDALIGTSAGRADFEMASPDRAAAAKGKGKKKQDPKAKRRARSENEENQAPHENASGPHVRVDLRIVKRGGANTAKEQREIIEHIADEYHLQGMGDPDQTIQPDGPRRGRRHRYAPLEWWRGERAVFGRARLSAVAEEGESDADGDEAGEDEFEDRPKRQDIVLPVPVLKEIVRIQREPGEGTFAGMRIPRRGKTKKSSTKKEKVDSKKRKAAGSDSEDDEDGNGNREIQLDERGYTRQPEDGWDEETDQMGIVWNVDTGEETTRRIACQRDEVKTRKVFNSEFKFEKVFGVDDFMAAGVIEIPVGGSKPVKPSKTNSYTFIVSEGAVRVRIHRSNFVMGPGGMFLVPKGNTYSIENIAKRESRLFFAQARDPNLDPEQARGATAAMSQGSQSVAGPSGSQYAAAGVGTGKSPAKKRR